MPLVETPKTIDDPEWERRHLGAFVDRSREVLARQRETGLATLDVRAVLRRAYDRVPFYQSLFARAALGRRDLEDPRALSSIPVTRRADLAAGVAPFLSHPTPAVALERGWLGRTSGSTGQPVSYLRDPRTIAWFWAFLDHALAYSGRSGARAGRRFGVVLLDTLGHMPEYQASLPLFHGTRFAKVNVQRTDAELAQVLSRLAPQVITGDPDSLACLARLTLPRDARPSLVLSSAFALPSALRDGIAAATGASVLEYYGAQELSVIALSCRVGSGFHAVSGACRFEAVPTDEGETELVVTPLQNRSFVLIRYAPGDLGSVQDSSTPCACGLRGLRLARLDGRTNVHFRSYPGGRFLPGRLTPLLSRLPVAEHRLVEVSLGQYLLRYRAPTPLASATIAPIVDRLRELSQGPATLTLLRSEEPLHARGDKPTPFEVAS